MMIQERILYEDDVLLVVNKPAGLMVEPDRNNHPNLLNQVKKYLKEKEGAQQVYAQHLHRLDRPVSGVVLFVKDKRYLRNLSEQFAQRVVKKEYCAFTAKAPFGLTGRLEHWYRKEKKRGTIVAEGTPFAEKVLLDYHCNKTGQYLMWKIKLHTGKFHQIRCQLAALNCPILGDTLYGSEISFRENTIALHAEQLTIQHPVTGEQMIFKAPLPDYLSTYAE